MPELSVVQKIYTNMKESKIDLHSKEAIKEWSVKLNCEEKDLIHAIMVIGNSTQMVDDFLILNRKKKVDYQH
ncbi:MAG: DUF3606 domain-containing protein [Bacteroidia bacterium]|nr:DUF3606 domain-containing protein [Bacteroidia bacterium]